MLPSIEKAMPLRMAPYLRLARRLIRGPGTPKSVSIETEVLCPEETSVNSPPIFIPGQIERATSATEHQPLEAEIGSMLASTYTHAPTIAYHVRNATVLDGSIYADNLRYFIADAKLFAGNGITRHLKTAGLASTTVGNRYFGHWLRDDCIQYLLAQRAGAAVCISSEVSDHKTRYASYFDQDWTPTDRAFVENLVIYQDFAQNSLKLERYKKLSSKIGAKFGAQSVRTDLVYVRRGATGAARPIYDEPTLIDNLIKRGFIVLDIARDDLDQVLKTLLRARLLVSIEGSHMTHCVYTLDQNCALLVLQPADRFTAVHRHWAASVGVPFGFVVGARGEQGYQFSLDEILRTIDLVLDRIGTPTTLEIRRR
jgi:hypothetical protein